MTEEEINQLLADVQKLTHELGIIWLRLSILIDRTAIGTD